MRYWRDLGCFNLKNIRVGQISISNVSARSELRDLMKALDRPGVTVDF
ncbi:hypothetical protein [Marimonas arenosa]|nr:hypothetical protein [Marimonas arenosa]